MSRKSSRLGQVAPSIRLSLIWMLIAAGAAVGGLRDVEKHFFDLTFGDLAEELRTARDAGKRGILIMFEMDGCPYCRRMREGILSRSEIQDYFKEHFLIFPVDIEGEVELTDFHGRAMAQKDFARGQLGVRATPEFAFFDLEGNLVVRFRGATRNAQEFRWLGEYVVDGGYEEMSFSRYRLERLEAAR